jgi:hypothetical protein
MANESKLEQDSLQSKLDEDNIEVIETQPIVLIKSTIEDVNITPVNKLAQIETVLTSSNHTSETSSDSDVPCSPVAALQTSSRIVKKLIHANVTEQKSKISDYFMPNA